MLNNILRLREVRVEDVMVPRADIQAVEITTTLGDLLGTFEQSGHSRMPVYSETLEYRPTGAIGLLWGFSLVHSPYANLDLQTELRVAFDFDSTITTDCTDW